MEMHKLHLSEAQKRKLLHQLPTPVVLDKAQGNKVRRVSRTGCGVRIHFDNDDALVHDNVMHGQGFSDLLSKATATLLGLHEHLRKSGAYTQAKNAIKKVVKDKAHSILKQNEAKFVAHDIVEANKDSLHPAIR